MKKEQNPIETTGKALHIGGVISWLRIINEKLKLK